MKLATQTIADDSPTLGRQVRTLQASVNETLARVEFDSIIRLTAQFYPENLPIRFQTKAKNSVFGVSAVYLRNLTQDSAVPLYGVLVDWVSEGGVIKVRSIDGLIPGQFYEIRLIAYA